MQEFWEKWYRSGLGSGWPSKTVWFAAKCAGPAAIGPVGAGGVAQEQVQVQVQDVWFAV